MNGSIENISVEIKENVIDVLRKYEQAVGMSESGGILLGGYIPQEKKYVITTVTEPSVHDKRGLCFFVRNKKTSQKLINEYWEQSEGAINYLGEWHTHACKWPVPSFSDRQLLKLIAKDNSNVWQFYFMIIVGQDNTFFLGIADEKRNGKIVYEMQFKGGKECILIQ